MIGETVGPYRITGKLGEGGMGVVYRGHDSRLGRDVAIKVLPEQVARDPERMARFEREARALAALNHPNIAILHGFEHNALVMELVEGPTLQEKIRRGPIPLDEAIAIARQIADALEAAHAKGITHRDLKPANVKLTGEGQVKLLDFGLATAAAAPGSADASDPENSPTLTLSALTGLGEIMGTAGYMSPEQARGAAVDKRSDIWSFGVVFYEMLTGKKLFTGETGSDILAAVLAGDIDLSPLPGSTPRWLTHLLERCLERDKKKRLRDIGDAFLNENLAPAIATPPAPDPPRRSWTLAAAAAGIALAAGGLAGWAFRSNGATGAEVPVHVFSFSPSLLGESDLVRRAAVSPDGKHIAYVAANKIWVRSLAGETPVAVEGSENGQGPFWSPDSRQIAFGAELELRKAIASGGRTSKVTRLSAEYRGGAWSLDGASIMMATVGEGLVEAPANGGAAKVLVAPPGKAGSTYYSPQYLPSPTGRRMAVASRGSRNQQTMLLIDLTSGHEETIGDGAYPYYSPTGHIIYQPGARRQGVWAVAYSAETGKTKGEAFAVREIGSDASSSAGGMLVWLDNNTFAERQLVWKDRQGRRLGVAGIPAPSVRGLAVSPDFTRASFATETQGNSDIWIQDLGSNRRTRFTFHPQNDVYAVWSPKGSEVIFGSSRLTNLNVEMFIQNADGSGEPRRIAGIPGRPLFASSWSADGLTVLINYQGPKTGPDIWCVGRNPDGAFGDPKPFLESPFDEHGAQFSPDAKWVAYESDESGRGEIYARRFPGGEGKRQISVRGGSDPRWRRDGKEIFFLNAETLFAVPVSWNGGSPLQAGDAVELFHSPGVRAGRFAGGQYDATRDGQRFLLFEPTEADAAKPPGIHVVSNWLGLRRVQSTAASTSP